MDQMLLWIKSHCYGSNAAMDQKSLLWIVKSHCYGCYRSKVIVVDQIIQELVLFPLLTHACFIVLLDYQDITEDKFFLTIRINITFVFS